MDKRNTMQRNITLEAVKSLASHATAEEVYEYVHSLSPNVSKATVYRNLKELSSSGEIRKVDTLDGPDRYDHNTHKHNHIMCEECGRIFDVKMKKDEHLEEDVTVPEGFALNGYELMFRGVCPECLKKRLNHTKA